MGSMSCPTWSFLVFLSLKRFQRLWWTMSTRGWWKNEDLEIPVYYHHATIPRGALRLWSFCPQFTWTNDYAFVTMTSSTPQTLREFNKTCSKMHLTCLYWVWVGPEARAANVWYFCRGLWFITKGSAFTVWHIYDAFSAWCNRVQFESQ